MVKIIINFKPSKSLRLRRNRHQLHTKKTRIPRIKRKLKVNIDKNYKANSKILPLSMQQPLPDLKINRQYEDYLSKYSMDRIIFLYKERENSLNGFLKREKEEFNLNIYLENENIDNNIHKFRNRVLYGLLEIKNQITNIFNIIFPDNFLFSVMALFELFLSRVNKEITSDYIRRIMCACIDIIAKEEGLGVFNADEFQNNFTSDDEIDILEATDFKIDPVKPHDFFSLFFFIAHFEKRKDVEFLNYLERFKKAFNKVAFNILFNENSKQNKPSTNYLSIFLIAYEETKNFLPKNDNYINDYISNFKNHINYTDEKYSLAKIQNLEAIDLLEKIKI